MDALDRRSLLKAGIGLGAAAAIPGCISPTPNSTANSSESAPTTPLAPPAPAKPSDRFDHLQPMTGGLSAPHALDYQERCDKLRDELRFAAAGALLVAGGASLRYFSGVSWGVNDRFFGALFFEKGEPIYFTPAFESARAQESIMKGFEIRAWEEDQDPMKMVGDALRERGLISQRLAWEVEIPYRYLDQFTKANPSLAVTSGFEPVRRCRMVKSAKELAIMRRADSITKTAIREAAKHLVEGTSEEEFVSWVGQAHRKLGASSPWAIGLFGPNAAYPHGTKERRKLREGDLVLCDAGASLLGYQSDVTRTFAFGKPSERQRHVWNTVKKAQDAAFAAIRPGVACEEIDKTARTVIEASGFGADYKDFHHRLGHGIGLEGHEEPYMVRGNKLPLQPGMTASNEPGIYLYGELGVRLEDVFVVTEDGAEYLGPASTDIKLSP